MKKYYQRGDGLITAPLTSGQGVGEDRIGPELMFGITMVYALVGHGLGLAIKELLEKSRISLLTETPHA